MASEAPQSRNLLLFGGFGFLAGIMATGLLAALLFWLYASAGLPAVLRSVFRGARTEINVSQPTVVHRIQQLERLETVVYTMEKIIGGEREGRILPKFLTGDRILLVVHGEVIAGIDLRKLRPQDVMVRGRAVQVTVPPPEVFTTRIDNARTRVYSRQTGLLTAVDPHLESEVRREAEKQLLDAALKDGVLATAQQNGRTTLTTLLKGFGFEQAEVR